MQASTSFDWQPPTKKFSLHLCPGILHHQPTMRATGPWTILLSQAGRYALGFPANNLHHNAKLTCQAFLQSYIHGQFLLRYEPEAVALYTSQGYETASSKRLMRATVLASDFAGEQAWELMFFMVILG
jgi:hypothetical protein